MSPELESIVQAAIDTKQIDALLRGDPGFEYLPRYSPSPTSTDIADVLLCIARRCVDENVRRLTCDTVLAMAESYDGVVPAAQCYLLESLWLARNRQDRIGLDMELLKVALNRTIARYKDKLSADWSSPLARDWPDALLGELRNIDRNASSHGAASFLE